MPLIYLMGLMRQGLLFVFPFPLLILLQTILFFFCIIFLGKQLTVYCTASQHLLFLTFTRSSRTLLHHICQCLSVNIEQRLARAAFIFLTCCCSLRLPRLINYAHHCSFIGSVYLLSPESTCHNIGKEKKKKNGLKNVNMNFLSPCTFSSVHPLPTLHEIYVCIYIYFFFSFMTCLLLRLFLQLVLPDQSIYIETV